MKPPKRPVLPVNPFPLAGMLPDSTPPASKPIPGELFLSFRWTLPRFRRK